MNAKKIDVPEAFKKITDFFLPYADQIYRSAEEMIDTGWEALDSAEREIAKQFLDDLLSSALTETDLREVWHTSRSSISPFRGRQGSCRRFLELMRSRYDLLDK